MHVLGRRASLAVLPLVSALCILVATFTAVAVAGGYIEDVEYPDRVRPGETIVFTGYVRDDRGNPVAGEEVWLELVKEGHHEVDRTVTDEDGFFRLTYTPDKPGTYAFEIWTEQAERWPGIWYAYVTVEPKWLRPLLTVAIPTVGIIGAATLYKLLKKRGRHLVPAVVVALVLLSLLHVWPASSSLPSWVAVGCGCGENEMGGYPGASIEASKRLGFVGDKFLLYGYSAEPNQEVRIGGWRDGIKEHVDIAVVVSDENAFWSYTWIPDKPGFYTLFACTEEACSRHSVNITVLPRWVKYAILAAAAMVGAVALRYAVRWRSKR